MRLQRYFPSRTPEQVLWLTNFRDKLPAQAGPLGLEQAEVTAAVADAGWLLYVLGAWLASVRKFPKVATRGVKLVMHGRGANALPGFTAPPLPDDVAPMPDGALERIFFLVRRIKQEPACTTAVAQDLGIATRPEARREVPRFWLRLERGAKGEMAVAIGFSKYGHQGVWIESRRGGAAPEPLGIGVPTPFHDRRPLQTPGQPEMREYRMRFWDKGEPNGEWTPWRALALGI